MSRNLVILAAAAAAASEFEQARRAGRCGPTAHPVDPLAVGRVLATLPDRARLSRRDDPDAPTFCLASWNPHVAAEVRLHAAVRDSLREGGLTVSESFTAVGEHRIPHALHVDFDSLAVVAELLKQGRQDWLATAKRLWAQRYGATADVSLEPTMHGEVVTFSTDPVEDHPGWIVEIAAPVRPTWKSFADWADHTPEAVVARAQAELKVPVWKVSDVAAAFAAALPGGEVIARRGVHTDYGVRDVPTLVPRSGEQEATFPVEEVYALTPAEIVAKVRAERPQLWAPVEETVVEGEDEEGEGDEERDADAEEGDEEPEAPAVASPPPQPARAGGGPAAAPSRSPSHHQRQRQR